MKRNKEENVSTIMLLPVLKLDKSQLDSFYKFGFKNTYLFCSKLTYSFNVIYIVFQPLEFSYPFYVFLSRMAQNKNFLEAYDIGYKKVLMVYKIPRKFDADYRLFLEGKYSMLSDAYKMCFTLERAKRSKNGHLIRNSKGEIVKDYTEFFHIFNRTQKLKDYYRKNLHLDVTFHFDLPDKLELFDIVNKKKEALEKIVLA